ncbi:MAG: cyanophycin synthetase, partial [Bacteroides sp.]
IGRFFEVSPDKIDHALETYTPQNNRSQLKETADNRLIIDAYNANPTSMMAALQNFRNMEVPHKMVVLGDMKELGADSVKEHRKIVDYLSECGFEQIMLAGDQFAATHTSYPVYANAVELMAAIEKDKPKGMYILIKGSNSMKLASVAEHL